jgi:small subunit ribosomal protein S20
MLEDRATHRGFGLYRSQIDKKSRQSHTTRLFLREFPAKITGRWRASSVANTKSADKAARQAQQHRVRNIALRSRMRSAIRKVIDAVASSNKEQARASYLAAVPLIDTLVNKNIIHRNQADRHKSRLAARVKALAKAP